MTREQKISLVMIRTIPSDASYVDGTNILVCSAYATIKRRVCTTLTMDVRTRIMSNARLRPGVIMVRTTAATKIRLRNGQGSGGSPRRRRRTYVLVKT